MAITIELPPQMEKEARGYSLLEGATLERMFLDYLKDEFARRRKAADTMARLDALVERTRGRLKGEPYRFNRADAYEPETPYA